MKQRNLHSLTCQFFKLRSIFFNVSVFFPINVLLKSQTQAQQSQIQLIMSSSQTNNANVLYTGTQRQPHQSPWRQYYADETKKSNRIGNFKARTKLHGSNFLFFSFEQKRTKLASYVPYVVCSCTLKKILDLLRLVDQRSTPFVSNQAKLNLVKKKTAKLFK